MSRADALHGGFATAFTSFDARSQREAGIVEPVGGRLAVTLFFAMAIGAGGTIRSWYDDADFRVVTERGGLTRLETRETRTVVTTPRSSR